MRALSTTRDRARSPSLTKRRGRALVEVTAAARAGHAAIKRVVWAVSAKIWMFWLVGSVSAFGVLLGSSESSCRYR